MPDKLFLIDGNAFCYRAFYAIQGLTNSKGEPTNAVYGFLAAVKKILDEEKPKYLAICFDRSEPTFRHEKYEKYKEHRPEMPDDLQEQMPIIKELAEAYRFPVFEKAGFEADDLMGTLAKTFASKDCKVFIATSDKDALQLVDSNIMVYSAYRDQKRIYDVKAVKQRFGGLGPDHVADLLSLWGDASDNIPGVPGVGEKTATQLLVEFRTLEGIYKQLDKIKKPKQKQELEKNKEQAFLARELATIRCDVPMKVKLEDLEMQSPDTEKLKQLFKRLEFHRFLKDIEPQEEQTKAKKEKRKYHTIETEKKFEQWLKQLKTKKIFSVDTETTSEMPLEADLVGLSFAWEDLEAYYIPVASKKHEGPGLPLEKVLEALSPILEDENIQKVGQNIKYDWLVLKRHGIVMQGLAFDTMIASYLINPVRPNHNLDAITFDYLGVRKIPTKELLGEGRNRRRMDQVPLETVAEYACEDADCVWRLVPKLKKELEKRKLMKLFETLEMPLVLVLAEMEWRGVAVDVPFLKKLSQKAEQELDRLAKEIYKEAGEEFNINSPKQLSTILFEKLKLPTKKRTKTGYSTDVNVLAELAEKYNLPKLLLEFREHTKLKTTYLDALPALVHPETKCVHTSLNQTVTTTGRLSSSSPNLQNIPIRTETGRAVRKAFVPRQANRCIVSADYSQIELRLLAHLSEDKALAKAFQDNKDVHVNTASILYGCPEKEVTRQMRSAGKVVNFSIIYGKTAYGLARDLHISHQEATGFIEAYFKKYAGVRTYLEEVLNKARKEGYTETICQRRCYFPEINSKNVMRRQFAERAAVNAPLQGSAADLIKLAMIALEETFKKTADTLMVLQVHDELVFDVLKSKSEASQKTIRQKMEQVLKLRVPLIVDIYEGSSWFKAA